MSGSDFVGGLIVGAVVVAIIFALYGIGISERDGNSVIIDGDKIANKLSEQQQLEIIQYVQTHYPGNAIYSQKYPQTDVSLTGDGGK